MRWVTGGLLTPLRKRQGGVHSVAVDETLRLVVTSPLISRFKSKEQKFLEPHQVGVATK